jgi:hypothetical protein
MNTPQTLPDELLFEPDGHLSEAALTLVADGAVELVSTLALGHLDDCDDCGHRLGEVALLSVSAGEALRAASPLAVAPLALAPAPSRLVVPAVSSARSALSAPAPAASSSVRSRPRRPLPVAAIVAALLIAVVTAGPAFVDMVRGAPGTLAGAVTAAPFFFRVLSAFVRAPWGVGSTALLVKAASALILGVVGLQVARMARSGSWQQGGV